LKKKSKPIEKKNIKEKKKAKQSTPMNNAL